MKAKDWQQAKLIHERQSQAAIADSSQLSNFSLSELPIDESGPPTVLQGPHDPLSTSTPVYVPQGNQQTADSAQEESSFQHVIPNIPQQSLYPSLATMNSSLNIAVSPSITLSRRVINYIKEFQRKSLDRTVEGTIKSTNTSLISELDDDEIIIPSQNPQGGIAQADTQDDTLQLESFQTEDTGSKNVDTKEDQTIKPYRVQNTVEIGERVTSDETDKHVDQDSTDQENHGDDNTAEDQTPAIQDDQASKLLQGDNYHTAITDDDLDDTVKFSNPVTEPFLSRSIRIPTTEVGCLSFTQMFQDYLHAYSPPSQADAHLQIQDMAKRLDLYLNKYPAHYINCMTSNSEFVAFINHAIQLALDLTVYPNIRAVLLILLETQDIQVMHDYYYECYNTRTEEYMIELEEAAEISKHIMYNNNFDRVSANIHQQMCDSQMPPTKQQDVEPENRTHIPFHACFNDILTEYTAWSTNTNDIENTYQVQYRENRQEILNAWQKDTPVKMPEHRQILDNMEVYSRDKQNITQLLNYKLGLTESSLPGVQQVTVAMVQNSKRSAR